MALINCPECGQQVSNKADFCPHCGFNINGISEDETAIFRLQREKKMYYCAAKYEAFIDGFSYGILENGDRIKAELNCGEEHHLKIKETTNFRGTMYDDYFVLDKRGLVMTFSASMGKLKMYESIPAKNKKTNKRYETEEYIIDYEETETMPATLEKDLYVDTPRYNNRKMPRKEGRRCPRCGGIMTIQTVTEENRVGCGTILGYILLAVTLLGILIVIPLLLRKKTKNVTYAVCQNCGYRQRCL